MSWPPARVGIGFSYSALFIPAIAAAGDLVDYLMISPESFCREHRRDGKRRFLLVERDFEEFLSVAGERPVSVHGLELSIGSAHAMEEACVDLIDQFHDRRAFSWFSEHLSFIHARDGEGRFLSSGTLMPLPLTDEALEIVAPRARALNGRYGVPFLLENLTHYLSDIPTDRGRDEVDFLNELTERSDCGLLLDLYNFHCNSVNCGFDAKAALARLRLDRVVEIHLAGGATHDGFLMDVHSSIVPEPVWELLDWILPQTPNLAGVTYELLDEAFAIVGIESIVQQLDRAKQAWARNFNHNAGASS